MERRDDDREMNLTSVGIAATKQKSLPLTEVAAGARGAKSRRRQDRNRYGKCTECIRKNKEFDLEKKARDRCWRACHLQKEQEEEEEKVFSIKGEDNVC